MILKSTLIQPGAKIGVVGLGITGKAAVRYIQACGAVAHVSDLREQQRFLEDEGKFLEKSNVRWEAGGHTEKFLQAMDLILVSPGIHPKMPLLQNLSEMGVPVMGELALAADLLKVPVVGITGTNGKTTVTTILGHIFKEAGMRPFVGGNIGNPLYYYLLCPDSYDILVLELSSFQLEACHGFAPDYGLLLNVSPDHLDWHGSMSAYETAKMNLFMNQSPDQYAILSEELITGQDPQFTGKGSVYSFGNGNHNRAKVDRDCVLLKLEDSEEEYRYRDYGQIRGVNRSNFAAAILTAHLYGLHKEEISRGLRSFSFLPHRLEYVDRVADVSYYNDSKATNTGAVIAALQHFDGNVVLIAGGRDKGDDYTLLRQAVAEKVVALVLLGEAAELLASALADLTAVSRVYSMEQAVSAASQLAAPGGTVILSPGCASFDMFTSYGHRGNEFKKEVARLKLQHNAQA